MNEETANKRLSELLVVLDRLTELHRDLHGLIREQIGHMRTGDSEGVQVDTLRQEALLKTLREQEGLRRQLMDAIGRGYGLNPQVARRMPARQLAERLEGRLRAKLLDAAERLRQAAREVCDGNRIAGLIARQVLHHLRCVFAAVAAPDQPPATYSPCGRMLPTGTQRLFEMTG